MASDLVLFAGVCISSGRKPLTFAALDDTLEVAILSQWDIPDVVACLNEYESAQLTIHMPHSKSGHGLFMELQARIEEAGFRHYSQKNSARLWIVSNAEQSFRVFQPKLFPRRSLEGRIQRGLILYEEGLQITDPMDFFEEVTRHKLMQGILPTEGNYTPNQLDALVMGYVSWLAGSPAEKVLLKGDLYLPAPE